MWNLRIRGIRSLQVLALLLIFGASFAAAQAAEAPLRVSGVRVVFFGPARAERDSLAGSEGLEIDDLLDDFNLYAGKTAVFLGRTGIPSEFTESRIVIVKVGAATYRTFDRRSIPDPVGMILTDGFHEPRVVPGRGTDRDLILEIREYFHLPAEHQE
jgi:hypothetical protein